ncbi:MAG: hypothetical protein K9J13_07710 [Saprospiraceae bacterium]|nr:hypothetical protein [Saprospiraceae bacterium]
MTKVKYIKILSKIIVLLFVLFPLFTFAQESNSEKFKALSRPEKFWVVFHPFVAKKAAFYSNKVRIVNDSIKLTNTLDGIENGGQVDAFRHAYWMALLSCHIHWRKALKLGKAHEKGNFIDYKKRKKEDGSLPDFASSEMDLWNNKAGIEIGRKYKEDISETQLQQIIIHAILKGEMRIIKTNSDGKFLDEDGNIIPESELIGRWENNKCLVPSNFYSRIF